MGLVSELRRRNVLRMAALFAVAAWLIMQVAEVVVSLAALPDWSGQVVLVLLAIGFPIALIFSWFYELTPEGISLEKDIHPDDSINQVTGRRIDFVVISLLSAAVILFAWHTWWPSALADKSNVLDEAIDSIAVLPLQNLSNDPDQEYFVEGMQDALITRLSKITKLRVISKTSTYRYESTDKSIPEIARELNVDALIEGSVLRDANRVRITAKLIHGAEDVHLWANSYDRDLDNILILINEISVAIADEIEVTVNQQEIEEWAQSTSANLQVHEFVLKGNHYLDRFMLDQSLRYYQQAIELDAEFAPAHAGVAASYLLKVFLDWNAGHDFIPQAREAALKAISLDGNFAGGYISLGFVQLYFDWDWEGANTSLTRALELRPNDSRARHAYADYLMVMGDLKESLNQVEIGHLYDPFSPMAGIIVGFHRILARQYDEAIEQARMAIAEEPDLVFGLSYYPEALWLKGMHEEALATYKRTWGRDEELLRAMNRGLSESGYTGAIHSLANALARRNPEFKDYVTLAKLYARAGEPGPALELLEKAYQYRQPQILHIKAMPDFDEFHSSPEFQDLLSRIGFPEASRR
jgi:TolB-like protein